MKLISRAEAKAAGLTQYFTGKPCLRGHIATRMVSAYTCRLCKNKECSATASKKAPARRQRIKEWVITKLGGECACCKEDRLVFLCIDHRKGGGSKHRRAIAPSGSFQFLCWLRRQILELGTRTIKRDFRVLCWNCNSAFAILGYCPHHGKPS